MSNEAVKDGELQHLSVSQINTFSLCPRKWYFSKIQRLVEPTSEAANRGIDIHGQLEKYLAEGITVTDTHALSVIPFLPPPKSSGVTLETPLFGEPLTAGGIKFKGFIDLLQLSELSISVWDYKTGKNRIKNRLKPQAFLTDPQMLGYAEWARRNFDWAKIIRVGHYNINTEGPAKCVPESHVFESKAEIRERWEGLTEPVVADMKVVAKCPTPDDVSLEKRKKGACEVYGGCPFKNICNYSPEKKYAMSLLEAMKNNEKYPVQEVKEPEIPEKEKYDAIVSSVSADAVADVLPPDAPKSNPALASKQPEEKPAKKEKKMKATNEVTIYVNCIPSIKDWTNLDAFVQEAASEVCKGANVPDLRLVDYGKGKGFLAALLKTKPLAPGCYVLLTKDSELNSMAAETLVPMADVVVRGI